MSTITNTTADGNGGCENAEATCADTSPGGALRILYINEALTHFGAGPAVHGWALIGALNRLGWGVTVFPPARAPVEHAWETPRHRFPSIRRLLRARLPSEPLNLISGVVRTVRRCAAIWIQRRSLMPDVIVGRHIAYDWTPWLASRLLRRPLVLEVNEPYYREKLLTRVLPLRALKWIEEVQWRKAERIYVVTRELADILVTHGVSATRIGTIANGVDVGMFGERQRSRSVPGRTRVVFVGGFYLWHGVDLLLDAAVLALHECPGLRFTLIGDGPERQRLARRVDDLGLSDMIEFPGRVSRRQVVHQLLESDVAVAPYPRLEPFYFSPLKLFEYMAAGLAIVASRQGQIQEILRHEHTGLLVPAGDAGALAQGILRLAHAAPLRVYLGANARRRVAECYTWDHTASQLVGLCKAGVHDYVNRRAQAPNAWLSLRGATIDRASPRARRKPGSSRTVPSRGRDS